MQKIYYIIILSVFCINSCLLLADEKGKYYIVGKISDSINNVNIYLTSSDWMGNLTFKDSTTVIKGKFVFEGITDTEKKVYSIWSVEHPDINGVVVIEPGTISYKYQEDSVKGYAYAKGTFLNDIYTDSILIPTIKMSNVGEKIARGIIDIRSPEIAELRSYSKQYARNIITFINKNSDNQVGGYVFLMYASVIPDRERNIILAKLPEDVRIRYQMLSSISRLSQVYNGQRYIPFSGKTMDNKELVLTDIVETKKMVILDFWASWCGPCIKEIPAIAKLYNDYKDKGLEIISVSIDENELLWKDAIQKHKMSWLQVISKKGEADDIGKLYGVSTIPYLVLINQKGEVVATNLRGQQLIEKVKDAFDSNN